MMSIMLTENILMEHASMGMEKYIRDHFKSCQFLY